MMGEDPGGILGAHNLMVRPLWVTSPASGNLPDILNNLKAI